MKTTTLRSLFAVAALAVAATASAQTYKADVPVSFYVGSKLMPAGSYQFRLNPGQTGVALLSVRTADSKTAALAPAAPGGDAPKAMSDDGNATIAFRCIDGACSLSNMWTGKSIGAYSFATPKMHGKEVERISSLTINLTRAD